MTACAEFIEPSNPRMTHCARCSQARDQHAEPVDTFLTNRDPHFEREFLEGAESLAGLHTGWTALVEARLARMERSKGVDSYKQLGVPRMLLEIDEEGLDLGGWPVLAALLLRGVVLEDEARFEAQLLLQEISAYGVRVHDLVCRLREMLP